MRHKIISKNTVFYANVTQQFPDNPSALIGTKQRLHERQGGTMHILKKQDGMSTVGRIFFIGLMIAVAIPGMKIIPIYMNNFKIHNALKKMESDVAAQTALITPAKIRQNLLDRFALQQMPEITPEDITVTQFRDKITVRITHRYKERLYRDRFFTLDIDKTAEIPIIIKN